MKLKLYILSVFLIAGLGLSHAQKIKTKTFKNKSLKVEYPNTWFKFGAIGHAYFMPKTIRKNTFENEVDHVSINKNVIRLAQNNSVEDVLEKYANLLKRNQIKKDFKIIELKSSSKFLYKIESTIVYNSIDETYKSIEYFFINENNNLENYRYQMREDLFDKYYNEAMLIINSVEKR